MTGLSRQQRAIYDALPMGVWRSNVRLNAICFRYGARLWDIKKSVYGFEYEKKSGRRGLVFYRRIPHRAPVGMQMRLFTQQEATS